MHDDSVECLLELGFFEYEAKACIALLRENPATGYQVSKVSGIPRSMVYEVLAKLTARGAAMELHKEGKTKYAPTPPEDFLDQLHRDHQQLVTSLRDDLTTLDTASDREYVWKH